MANKTHLRLKDARSAKKLLAKLINQLYRGEIEGDTARDLGYLIRIFLDVVETSDLEKRVALLEERLRDGDKEPYRAFGT
jgi:hypothetical protein